MKRQEIIDLINEHIEARGAGRKLSKAKAQEMTMKQLRAKLAKIESEVDAYAGIDIW